MSRTAHLKAGGAAILILAMGLLGFSVYARYLERHYVNALAGSDLPQILNGSALQRAALQQPDLLPVYGSSEITLLDTAYQANKFFSNYPTGFMVFDVANLGASSITIAEALAGLGPDLRGRKIAISFSPATFTMSRLPEEYYAGNYSRLHAYETIFSPYLSLSLKSTAAKRMLDFPTTLEGDDLLQFALAKITNPARRDLAQYYLAWPLGELQLEVLSLQDHADVVSYIMSSSINSSIPRQSRQIDWSATLNAALAEQKQHTLNNPYGVEDSRWWYYQHVQTDPIPSGSEDKRFTQRVLGHPEWSDLDILLRVLKELGAEPLILSRPMNVHLWEALGVSEQAQNTYYNKLHAVVNPYHMTLIDFQKYGTDIYFSIDQASHTSREGWVYVDQTLDAFFHGRLH